MHPDIIRQSVSPFPCGCPWFDATLNRRFVQSIFAASNSCSVPALRPRGARNGASSEQTGVDSWHEAVKRTGTKEVLNVPVPTRSGGAVVG